MNRKNRFSQNIYLIVLFLFALTRGNAAENQEFLFDAHVPLDSTAEKAIEEAQNWLAERQRQDGSWDTRYGRNNAGEIAYAILALMVNGSVPGEGKFAKEVGRGLQFLLNSQRENGLIMGASDSQGPMYQHALATLAILEIYGMTQNPRTRSAASKAVNLIIETQHEGGGWRYQPKITPGDISISVMQVMALRAAVETGLHVPDETIERAIRFIKNCFHEEEKGFTYMPNHNGAAFPRTGAGLVCLQTVGLHDDPIIPDVVKYLMNNAFPEKEDSHQWYGHYYTSIALYHYGGSPWKTYYPKIRKKILNEWKGDDYGYHILNTAWRILILGVPYRYLPIYQR